MGHTFVVYVGERFKSLFTQGKHRGRHRHEIASSSMPLVSGTKTYTKTTASTFTTQ